MDKKAIISNAAARIGYPNVCPKQEAISYFIDRKDVFVSLPTGRGLSTRLDIEDKRSSS